MNTLAPLSRLPASGRSATRLSPRCDLSAEYVKSRLSYDPNTGIFVWKNSGSPVQRRCGMAAGSSVNGYVRIVLEKRSYAAHRLAWLVMTGKWPSDLVDHKNMIPSDNRWSNLREASNSQNLANASAHKNNISGLKGVYSRKRFKKWVAQIKVGGKAKYLGSFENKEDAAAAYFNAAKKYHGEFARAK